MMISALLFLASCGKEEGDSVAEPNPMFGNITDPAWSVSTDYDYTTSMTAVIGVDLAAFVGDECVGLVAPSGTLFFLFIVPPQHAEDGNFITLRYYSSYYHNIFHSDDVFPFVNGSQQGTVNNPLLVVFSKDIK